jgi:hypothetical protein
MTKVAEHQLRVSLSPSSNASIAASSLSSIMLNIASHQLHVANTDAPPRKRPATGKADSINVVRNLISNDAHNRIYPSTLPAATATRSTKKQKTTTFPKPHAAGTTKKLEEVVSTCAATMAESGEPAGEVTEDYHLVELAAQHDSTSCGVYCLAVALDRITGDYFFQQRGEVGASASCQLRIRFLRKILFGSSPT